jgi:hypothetical protein
MSLAFALILLLGFHHPIHSSSAVVSLPVGGGPACIVVRVFADDFPPGDSPAPIGRYLAARFRILDRDNHPVALHLDSVRADGVVLVLTLSASAEALSGARIWHGILAERFSDQVNLVQVHRGTRSASLLFTSGDGPKPLP